MLDYIFTAFWFFLPAGIANMTPVLFKDVPIFNYPLDFRRTFKGKRILGENKTFRGLFFGTLSAILVVYIQAYLNFESINYIEYSSYNLLLLGFVMGFGALIGDAIESFAKRQKDIKPGKSLWPFDQIDWIIGSLLATWFLVSLTLWFSLTIIIIYSLLHPTINYLGYLLKIKENKF